MRQAKCPKCGLEFLIPSRTTGARSQNHALNGYVQQIAQSTGNNFETVKTWIKTEAIGQGYPVEDFQGRTIPLSESKSSRAECAILIDVALRLAAELDIRLVEA